MISLRRLFRPRPAASIVERVLALVAAPSPALVAAITETANVLTDPLLGSRLKALRPALVLIFARQAADGARRRASSHWTSDRGHNVGLDVLLAQGRALETCRRILAQLPRSRRPLDAMIAAMTALIEAQRRLPGDDDGYGIATLHEIHRDLTALRDGERARTDRFK